MIQPHLLPARQLKQPVLLNQFGKTMRPEYWLMLSLLILCRTSAAQGFSSLYQYFESDSIAAPGYSSMEQRITQTNMIKGRENTKINTIESFYDESGRLIMEERSSNVSNIVTQLDFAYDSISNRLNYILQTGVEVKHEAFGRYDEQGRLAEIIYCQQDQPCQSRYYVFDEDYTERLYISRQAIALQLDKGQKAKSIFGVAASGAQKGELIRERFFDPEGRLEEIRMYSRDTFVCCWQFEYDINGLKTKMWVYNNTGKKLATDYEYDEEGRLAKEVKHFWADAKGKFFPYQPESSITYFEYDDNNKLVRTENTIGKSYNMRKEFKYYKR